MNNANQHAIKDHRELEIYGKAFDAAMEIFQLSKTFPVEERYCLTDQINAITWKLRWGEDYTKLITKFWQGWSA